MNNELIDSGVEWIGKIPSSWEVKRVGSEYKVRTQKVNDNDYLPLSVTKLTEGIVPQMENVAKSDAHDDRKLVLKGDFVINSRSDRKMSCGVSKYDGSVSLINTVLEPTSEISSDFTHYLLKNYAFAEEFYRWGHGIVADLWTTNASDLKRISIPVPSQIEQEKIVASLDKKVSQIDTLISNQEKQIKLLEEYRIEKIRGIIWSNYREKIKLKYICKSFNSNIAVSDLNLKNNVTKVYGASGLAGYTIDKGIENEYIGIIKDGAGVGRTNIYEKNTLLLGTMAYVIPNNNIDIEWLNYLLFSMNLSESIDKTTIPHIYFSEYGNRYVPNLKIKDQKKQCKELCKYNSNILDLIKLKQSKIEKLQEYKKSLIYEYVTGKKKVD